MAKKWSKIIEAARLISNIENQGVDAGGLILPSVEINKILERLKVTEEKKQHLAEVISKNRPTNAEEDWKLMELIITLL